MKSSIKAALACFLVAGLLFGGAEKNGPNFDSTMNYTIGVALIVLGVVVQFAGRRRKSAR